MLVLSRKIGERIVIDNLVVITVIEVRGQQVRLGLEAPEDVGIWREEVRPPDGAGMSNGPARFRP